MPRSTTCALLFALAWPMFAACSDDASDGSGAAAGTSATGTSSTSTGTAASCEANGGKCIAIPAGFQGPIALHDDGTTCTTPVLHGGYAGDPFVAPPAECACTCSSPNANCTIEGTAYDANDCSGNYDTFDASPIFCRSTPDLGAPVLSVDFVATASDTTYCATDQAAAILPPVVFDPPVDGCDASIGSCPAGSCVASTQKVCVYSSTSKTCPAGFEESHTIIQEVDFDDTRDCGCICGFPVAIGCAPAIELHSDSMCIGDVTSSRFGGCVSSTNGDPIIAIDSIDGATADCSDMQLDPSGSVTLGGDGTLVCCTPG